MAKWQNDAMLDAALNYIKNNVTTMHVCSSQPADRAAAIAASLADVAFGSADVTLGNGDTNGRKATMAQKSSVPIDASGTATHIALIDGTNLLYVTTCTSQALTAGGTVTVPAWDVEIADAA